MKQDDIIFCFIRVKRAYLEVLSLRCCVRKQKNPTPATYYRAKFTPKDRDEPMNFSHEADSYSENSLQWGRGKEKPGKEQIILY